MKFSICLFNLSYRPQRVLGISKLSSLEFLKSRNPDLNESQILSEMQKQGKDAREILNEHQLQIACEKNLARILKNLDISFRITKRITDASKCVHWADLVIPIGGDGTFLLASKLIKDNTKPVIGINPSVKSESNIFTLPSKYSADIEKIFEKLHSGEYTLLMRSRIRTIMNGEGLYRQPFHIHEKSRTQGEKRIEALVRTTQRKIADALQPRQRILPWLALNEVFMGEFLAARAITLYIQVENEEEHMVRSSGVCVCTGSGSKSWYKSMNVQPCDTIRSIISIAMGKELKEKEMNDLLSKYHSALSYSAGNVTKKLLLCGTGKKSHERSSKGMWMPLIEMKGIRRFSHAYWDVTCYLLKEDLQMTYMIREMYRTSRYQKTKCYPERGMCKNIIVKSGGFDAGLVIDGSISLPFNDGTTASFEIRPEYALKNIILD